jgi:hypothetical protein
MFAGAIKSFPLVLSRVTRRAVLVLRRGWQGY